MKLLCSKFLIMTIIFIGCFCVAQAQIKQMKNDGLISEVTLLRQKLVEAIKKRDQKTLKSLYSDDFTHTHASGQVDDKAKRIAALVSGEPTIESAKVNKINIRIYEAKTAVAVGQSTITDAQQRTTKYRWTVVYVKSGKKWQIVASQATRLSENK